MNRMQGAVVVVVVIANLILIFIYLFILFILFNYYLRQVNEVNGGDNVFVQCVSVSVCMHSGPVNQTSLKRLKLRTSNLTRMLPGTVRT